MYGLFINCKAAPFIAEILARLKRDETRTRDMLRAIIGQRVALIETGTGPAPIIRGYATIGTPRRVSFDDIDARRTARILGTSYDIQPGGTKVFYPLLRVRPCKPYPLPTEHTNHGRSYTEFSRPTK